LTPHLGDDQFGLGEHEVVRAVVGDDVDGVGRQLGQPVLRFVVRDGAHLGEARADEDLLEVG
jgi:hypothetical protein